MIRPIATTLSLTLLCSAAAWAEDRAKSDAAAGQDQSSSSAAAQSDQSSQDRASSSQDRASKSSDRTRGAAGADASAGAGQEQAQAAAGREAGEQDPTKLFVKDLYSANQFEIQLGQLAGQRAQDDQIKQFARMMVQDH